MKNWTDMTPEAFGLTSPARPARHNPLTLFDLPEPAPPAADDDLLAVIAEAEELPAGTRVRVARRGGATGTVQAKDPVGAWFDRAHNTRPTVSIKFDGAGHGLNYPEDVEVLDEPVGSVPVWVRICGHVGCRLTAPHKHGVR